MKKVLAKILCLSMIALSLTSCGGKKNRLPPQQKENRT